jgi:ATP-dependent helicase YprA (DUF1998 family)
VFQAEPGQGESFLSPPVFEALFDWESQDLCLEDVEFLDPALVRAMDQPPEEHAAQRFARDIHPYLHQMRAWQALQESPARSVIVSTGTASGKTECFLVPILNDLAKAIGPANESLEGVSCIR